MKKLQALFITLAMGTTLAVTAAALASNPQNTNQSAEACCDMKDCCKAGDNVLLQEKEEGQECSRLLQRRQRRRMLLQGRFVPHA